MSAILYQEQNEGGLHLLTYKERRLAPDYIDSLRSFDECKLVRIMQGSGVWEINGDFYPFRRNDLFLFSRLDYRRIRSVGSAARIEQVTFIPAAVFPYQRCTGLFFTWPSGFSNRLPEGREAQEIRNCFAEMRRAAHDSGPYQAECIRNLLSRMVILAAMCGPPADPVAPAGDKNTLIASAMQYINGHLAEPLSLTKVAAVFSFSPAYFARAFRQAAGIPFTDYVARCRVNAVIAAISSRNINILDAAFQYGFRSSSGFYKTFTRVTGCPPGAFRRS